MVALQTREISGSGRMITETTEQPQDANAADQYACADSGRWQWQNICAAILSKEAKR
jgi:hypothetical protein